MGVGCANPEESKFEALNNEKLKFLANQSSEYCSNYPYEVVTKVGTKTKVGTIKTVIGGIDIPT